MTGQRRFEETIISDPGSVKPLPDDHPAITNARPLFPTMVVPAEDRERLFVSGHNSRKIGRVITKGAWKGLPIYTLTLPERTTCPAECHMIKTCYGNAMPFAVRREPGRELEERIPKELRALAQQHREGFVIRLHVLGDFYSTDYARVWLTALEEIEELHVYGYTAVGLSTEAVHFEIGDIICDMNQRFEDRCFIRFSDPESIPGGATTINRVPELANVAEGLVCPAEREATACCSTCGMCWEKATRDKTIVFVLHGMGSSVDGAVAKQASKTDERGLRQIKPIPKIEALASRAKNSPPTLLWVDPTTLYVDESYQRNLSRRSIKLISQIVSSWDWTHVKPPIVCRDESGRLEVIDGQHTAIAAACHPGIDKLPVMIVEAVTVAARARAFVGHNRDRIVVTPAQIHHSMVAAGDIEALAVQSVCDEAGVKLLRYPPTNGEFKTGECLSVIGITKIVRAYGSEMAQACLTMLVNAGRAPVRAEEAEAVIRAIKAGADFDRTADALKTIEYADALAEAQVIADDIGVPRREALAMLYIKKLAPEKVLA